MLAVAKPVIISANEAMIVALKKQPKDIYKLTPRQYEELVAELFRDMGYDVTLTKATRDGGKDILAAIKTEIGQLLCLVEAKRYREDRKFSHFRDPSRKSCAAESRVRPECSLLVQER